MVRKQKLRLLLSILFSICILLTGQAQDPTRLQGDVDAVKQMEIPKGGIIFTGSSSIRLWPNLNDWFPEVEVYNTGFGGSETSDLIHYIDELILDHQPRKVFIYEGDNDVNSGKSTTRIISDMEILVRKIEMESPATEIILISAKPSEERWHLKARYEEFNAALESICKENDYPYVDVWSAMISDDGDIIPNLFKADDKLHMNADGYRIWQALISPYVN